MLSMFTMISTHFSLITTLWLNWRTPSTCWYLRENWSLSSAGWLFEFTTSVLMTGQYNWIFHNPAVENAWENKGDGVLKVLWCASWSSTIQLVIARFIERIHCSSMLDPNSFISNFDVFLDWQPAKWFFKVLRLAERISEGASYMQTRNKRVRNARLKISWKLLEMESSLGILMKGLLFLLEP